MDQPKPQQPSFNFDMSEPTYDMTRPQGGANGFNNNMNNGGPNNNVVAISSSGEYLGPG